MNRSLLTALVTTLAMSASTAASAWPYHNTPDRDYSDHRTYDHDHATDRPYAQGNDRERYDRYDRSHFHRDFRGRWVPLAQGYSAQTERQFINVRGDHFRTLRIESDRGQPVVLKIAIEYVDKTGQAVELNEALPVGAGEVIKLNEGQRINRIIVYTDPRSRGAYSVYGT